MPTVPQRRPLSENEIQIFTQICKLTVPFDYSSFNMNRSNFDNLLNKMSLGLENPTYWYKPEIGPPLPITLIIISFEFYLKVVSVTSDLLG